MWNLGLHWFSGCTVGPNAVIIKLCDRETLMKEREERLKVFLSLIKLLKCYSCLLLTVFEIGAQVKKN